MSTRNEAPIEMTRFHIAKILAIFSMRTNIRQMNLPSDEQLCGSASDPDSVEDLIQVIRNKTVTRPLGEPPYSDCDQEPSPIPGSLHESEPADVLVH